MTSTAIAVKDVPPIEHDEAMRIADVEYGKLLDLAGQLTPTDWSRPTDCTEWDVKAVPAHLLGMMELLADKAEAGRQMAAAAQVAEQKGCIRLDALTGLQVEEHAHLTPTELGEALRAAAPRALAGRRETSDEERAAPYITSLPGEGAWTRGYLLDIIQTRDPWIHRVDICRATGRELVLTAAHDGRIVADVVSDWARRHGAAFTLVLDGLAGGTFTVGEGGLDLRLDAVEFCRILSGRGAGEGLLAARVPF